MLYKNILRTIKLKPLQFCSLILIIAMSSFSYVTLQNAIHSLDYFLDAYTEKTKQEDFLLVFNPPSQQDLVEIMNEQDINLEKVSLIDYYDYKSNELELKYDVTMEGRFYKDVFTEGDITHTYRFIKATQFVNKTELVEGALPTTKSEIAIFKQYADANGLQLQDTLKIHDQTFEITGFIAVADYIYPIFSYDSPLFEPEYETIVLALDEVFDDLDEKAWVLYSGFFNDGIYDKQKLDSINKEDYTAYSFGRELNVRISTIYTDMQGNELLAKTFSNVILLMAIFIIILILRKRIESDSVQIGILKAMGYHSVTISCNYVLYPLLASVCGALSGYGLGVLASKQLSNFYVTNYIIPRVEVLFNPIVFINGVIYPIFVITTVSFVILCYLLYKKPLQLMQKESHLKVSFISRTVTKFLAPLRFETRFRYSLAFRNLGKILGLFLTVLIASIFLVFSSMSFSAINTLVDKAFANVLYDYQVKFKKPLNEPLDMSEAPFLEMSVDLLEVKKQDGEIVTYESQIPFFILGIDTDNFINPLFNAKKENITSKVKGGIIINEFISRAYQLDIGEKMVMDVNNKTVTYEIVEIVDHYNGPLMYVDLYQLDETLNYDKGTYNGMWTSTRPEDDSGISYVLSIKDLTRNLDVAMDMVRLTLGVMISIAAGLSLIIMILIANIVIEENDGHIAVLKVLGYHDKEISNLILTMYLPFVLLAYLLSIPITRWGMDMIMAVIASKLPFSIPTTFGLHQILIGLLIVFMTYYLSLLLSKAGLRKISLQEALKH